MRSIFFFFNDTATTEIYTLSLHDALPIYSPGGPGGRSEVVWDQLGRSLEGRAVRGWRLEDRKSTRLNSSHSQISYAVFCLKKKKSTVHHKRDDEEHKKKNSLPERQ